MAAYGYSKPQVVVTQQKHLLPGHCLIYIGKVVCIASTILRTEGKACRAQHSEFSHHAKLHYLNQATCASLDYAASAGAVNTNISLTNGLLRLCWADIDRVQYAPPNSRRVDLGSFTRPLPPCNCASGTQEQKPVKRWLWPDLITDRPLWPDKTPAKTSRSAYKLGYD